MLQKLSEIGRTNEQDKASYKDAGMHLKIHLSLVIAYPPITFSLDSTY